MAIGIAHEYVDTSCVFCGKENHNVLLTPAGPGYGADIGPICLQCRFNLTQALTEFIVCERPEPRSES